MLWLEDLLILFYLHFVVSEVKLKSNTQVGVIECIVVRSVFVVGESINGRVVPTSTFVQFCADHLHI